MRRDIYYHEIAISYKKGKAFIKDVTWAVSLYKTPMEIMKHDRKTMSRLKNKYYSSTYKSHKQVVITKVISSKVVGTPSVSAV